MVRVYNRVARALIEFETLWQQAWLQSLEVARTGLQATLIVAHPDTGNIALLPHASLGMHAIMAVTKPVWKHTPGLKHTCDGNNP